MPPKSCGARMQTMDVPPSRKSIFALGEVKWSGPHHFITYSGSAQAFQTISTGALNVRVKVRSRVFIDLLSVVGFLKIGDDDFLHLQHRIDNTFCLDGIRVAD